jgi:hypothetical protein
MDANKIRETQFANLSPDKIKEIISQVTWGRGQFNSLIDKSRKIKLNSSRCNVAKQTTSNLPIWQPPPSQHPQT